MKVTSDCLGVANWGEELGTTQSLLSASSSITTAPALHPPSGCLFRDPPVKNAGGRNVGVRNGDDDETAE